MAIVGGSQIHFKQCSGRTDKLFGNSCARVSEHTVFSLTIYEMTNLFKVITGIKCKSMEPIITLSVKLDKKKFSAVSLSTSFIKQSIQIIVYSIMMHFIVISIL